MKHSLLSIFLGILFAGTTLAQTPIAHWPLDGNTQEIIGNKHGVPSTGGVSWANDPVRGQCLQLDGVEGMVTLPSVIWESEADTNTTITCWFNWAGGADWQRIYSLGIADPVWQLMYFCPRDGWDDHNLHVTFHAFEPDQWYDYVGAWGNMDFDTVDINRWYFAAVILKEDSIKIWIDDKLVTAEDSVYVTPQKIQPPDAINVLGKSHWADPLYNGMIDDFRIYGEALTNAQVLALYEEGTAGIRNQKAGMNLNFYGVKGRIEYSPFDESRVSNVAVYSITGRLLFRSDRISDLKSRQFNPGIYLVTVTDGNEHFAKKVALLN
ncbi:MAG: T9SS type A sorting domain-containing protein [Bacteroidales bacterium]|nr:T9SS type A sorting domain-containing protein [Bacteroidales bacterium]